MKKLFVSIGIISIIFTSTGCEEKKVEKENKVQAKTIIEEVRALSQNKEYEKAFQVLDKVYKTRPSSEELEIVEILGDSIHKIINQNKLESLDNIIKQYKDELSKERNSKNKARLTHKIDSVERLKKVPLLIIDHIENKGKPQRYKVDEFEYEDMRRSYR